jgi:phosphatidylglycerophosphatase A
LEPKTDPISPQEKLAIQLATGFGIGMSPVAPGTFGSLLGLPLAWVIGHLPGFRLELAANIACCLAGVLISDMAIKCLGRGKDPGCVVIDEVVAMPITFFLIPITSIWIAIAGFVLFRVFDIAKPPPARQLEKLPGGLGVMADDWAAAVYANLALRLLLWAWERFAI